MGLDLSDSFPGGSRYQELPKSAGGDGKVVKGLTPIHWGLKGWPLAKGAHPLEELL
jgi:hypothetical protein